MNVADLVRACVELYDEGWRSSLTEDAVRLAPGDGDRRRDDLSRWLAGGPSPPWLPRFLAGRLRAKAIVLDERARRHVAAAARIFPDETDGHPTTESGPVVRVAGVSPPLPPGGPAEDVVSGDRPVSSEAVVSLLEGRSAWIARTDGPFSREAAVRAFAATVRDVRHLPPAVSGSVRGIPDRHGEASGYLGEIFGALDGLAGEPEHAPVSSMGTVTVGHLRRWRKATEAVMAAARGTFVPTHRHLGRDGLYRVLGRARLQTAVPLADMAELTVYAAQDGDMYARPPEEFSDGRFETLPTPPRPAP